MDAVLDEQKIIMSMMDIMSQQTLSDSITENEDLFDDSYVLSLWVKEKNVIRPSGEIKVSSTLEPGVYTIESDRELGIYCQKINAPSDELFIFSDSVTDSLLEEIDIFWEKSALYEENHLIHKRGILLEGYPGTGKTSVITQASNRIIDKGGVVFKISGPTNLEHYITFIRTAFRKIQPNTPIITILEEINQYENSEAELLDFLDGKTHINHHVVIATSNNTENIPDAFLRPSRMDLRIEVKLPSEQTRREYFQYKGVPLEQLEELVNRTQKCSLADLKEIYICIFLLDYSLEDALSKISNPKNKKNYSHNPRKNTKIGL